MVSCLRTVLRTCWGVLFLHAAAMGATGCEQVPGSARGCQGCKGVWCHGVLWVPESAASRTDRIVVELC